MYAKKQNTHVQCSPMLETREWAKTMAHTEEETIRKELLPKVFPASLVLP